MQQDGPRTPYEVYCQGCHVSFAAGTKNCIHCGARLDKQRYRARLELPTGSEEIRVDDAGTRRSSRFSPLTLVWVALLVAGYLYRSCSGSAP